MGYRRKTKTYRLEFTDPDFEGLVVRAKSLPLREFLEMSDLASEAARDPAKGSEQTIHLLRRFAGSLVEWNLEDEFGDPVPTTYDGVVGQDYGFILAIIDAWMTAVADVDPTSRASANGGGTFPEVSLPMEPLSPNPQS